ncbi:translation initiation factor 3 subunit I [Nematocida displodere]|uniref:Serine-threonine kinase receptor-associated protein n=1 Tax=Nematocida displodere TaxID=1805483 RepID=A0A177EGY7_9MICR|nr:translation initiation factor 3 subunit I [Nematocida displodere]
MLGTESAQYTTTASLPMDLVEPASSWQLRHHQRALTDVKFNRDGDLLFTACKNISPAVWRVSTGTKIGTYQGHLGAVFSIDVDAESRRLVTGSGDGTGILWDVETGKIIFSFDNDVTTKSVAFTQDSARVVMCTDAIMGHPPKIWVYDTKSGELIKECETETIPTTINTTLDNKILYGDVEGCVSLIDERTFSLVAAKKIHQAKITSLAPSFCHTYFTTGSDDFKSKIFSTDAQEISVVREFLSDSPINSSRTSPDNRMVICGGGTNAREVTTTGGRGNFHIEVFDCVTSRLVGYYNIHFGTVNAIDIHPSGRALVSGGEDGVVNLIRLDDDSFLTAPFTPFEDVEG